MVSPLLIRHQGPMLRALGRVVAGSLSPARGEVPPTPGPELRAEVPPRADALVDAYARWSGAAEARYDRSLPPHMFPQWGFPLLARTLEGLPFKLARVLNQGCRIENRAPLPRGVPLQLRAWLEAVSEAEDRVRIHQRLVTGTPESAEALIADVHAVVLTGKAGKRDGTRPEEPDLPEIARFDFGPRAGLDYALLTGDFNPIHWLPPYAKVAGFPNTILHGFGSLARSYEALTDARGPLTAVEVRFVRPLVLPGKAVLEAAPAEAADPLLRLRDAKGRTVMAGRWESAL